MSGARRQSGMALIAVMFFMLLAVAGVATFLRRATVDGLVAIHREYAARCEALARGGVQLATALLLQDRIDEAVRGLQVETLDDLWARAAETPILTEDGGELRLRIEDAGSRVNLNALVEDGTARHESLSEAFLAALLERVIQEIPGSDEERYYDAEELARNLLDYLDEDDVRIFGGLEDDYYLAQSPPYRAANRPLLSVDELGLVQGFDGALVEALRPYVTVHPYAGGGGINPNTAPAHVLALLYSQDALNAGASRLASAEQVREILERRERGEIFCDESFEDENRSLRCVGLSEVIPGQVYPAPAFRSDVFLVSSEARVGEVSRTVEAVLRRSRQDAPPLLSWRVR